jgi:molybdate transport system substrate-binding protein
MIVAASVAVWQLMTPPSARAEDLMVSAAISMKEALRSIAANFERDHPGTHVILNCASSGVIEQQVKHGAPVDVVVTASPREMSQLANANLLAGEAQIFAYNRLVIVVPKGSPKYTDIKQLTGAQRIAVGTPASVPAGSYAIQALQKSNTYSAVKEKLVYFQNVREVLTFVESGNVNAGFVYQSDASHSKNTEVTCIITKTLTAPIAYEIARTKASTHADLAKPFINLVMNAASNKILEDNKFQRSWQ